MSITRIVIVTKRTPYEALIAEYGTHGQAAFVLQSRGEDIATYRALHEQYYAAVQLVETKLPKDTAHTLVERALLPRTLFRADDLVIAIGPDGLFANLAKYLSGQPVIGVNPLPAVIDGVVMRFAPEQVGLEVANLIALSSKVDLATYCEEVVLAEAVTNEGERLLAVNDFLVGRLDHVSARYRIKSGTREESQSSSGVLISTGMGASGWMRSVKTAAQAMSEEGSILLADDPSWDEERLLFVVREPFQSRSTQADIVFGEVVPRQPLIITSEMPEGGVIFSDGVTEDAISLSAGATVTIGIAPERVLLLRP